MRRSWMLLTVTAMAALGFVSHASAATVGFVPAAPIAEVAYVFAADVTTEQTSWVHVKYRRVGGLPCAPSPESDPGSYLIDNVRVSSGTQRVTRLATVASAGDYQVCAWLRNNSSAVLATQTAQLSVRAPAGSLTLDFPDYVPAEQTVVVRVTGQTEVPRQVYAKVRPSGGAPCAPSPDSDTGSYVFYAHSVQGAFAVQNTLRLDQRKTWLVCGWLADYSGDISPLATASRTISSVPPVVASPPATLTRTAVNGRRLSAGVRLPQAGRAVVRLLRGSRRVVIASISAPAARSVQVRYRRPASVPAGRYTLEVRFTARGANTAAVTRRSVTLR